MVAVGSITLHLMSEGNIYLLTGKITLHIMSVGNIMIQILHFQYLEGDITQPGVSK